MTNSAPIVIERLSFALQQLAKICQFFSEKSVVSAEMLASNWFIFVISLIIRK